MKILFVCSGNTCRSAMAEGYYKHLIRTSGTENTCISSAGTSTQDGLPASSNAQKVLGKRGIDLSAHRSRIFTGNIGKDADIIFVMTPTHKARVLAASPGLAPKVHLLAEYNTIPGTDVKDPWGGDEKVYEECFRQIKDACDNLFLDMRDHKKEKN